MNLLSTSASPEQSDAGVMSLVDALAELSADVDATPALRASFRANVLAAREALRGGRAMDDRVATALRDAQKALHGGSGVVSPPPEGDLEALAMAARARLGTARTLLDKGQVDASARALLEAALMIVTPAGPGD